jgi:hypothetical protein
MRERNFKTIECTVNLRETKSEHEREREIKEREIINERVIQG